MADDCTAFHCSQQQGDVNKICKDEDWPIGHKVLVCDEKGKCCNCHCSCFAFGTLIAVPNGVKKIEEIKVKDLVFASGTDLKWNEVTIEFSGGTSGSSDSPFMLEVSFKKGEEIKKLVCTKDQPFLMVSKLLKRADEIVAGDQLLQADGSTVEALETKLVTVDTGVHHVSTGTEKPVSLENHLLNAEGFIVADYVVQLFQDELPQFFEKKPNVATKASRLSKLMDVKELSLNQYLESGLQKKYTFWHHTLLNHTLEVPGKASTFVTPEQADQIKKLAPKHDILDSGVIAEVEYLFTIFKAFYPQVNFLLDWSSIEGNAFAVKTEDQYYIIVQGGLARCKALQLPGLAIILAHELGHLFGGDPKGPDGYSCEVQADFYGTRIVMRKVWYDDLYVQMVFPGIDQIQELFSYVKDSTIKVPGCVTPTLKCRIETLRAGATSAYPPACAGGPVYDFLAVTGAVSKQPTEVNVSFNEAVYALTANDISNYVFDPKVEIASATVSGTAANVVRVVADLKKGVKYTVTVSNVIAENGEQLDAAKSSAGFIAK